MEQLEILSQISTHEREKKEAENFLSIFLFFLDWFSFIFIYKLIIAQDVKKNLLETTCGNHPQW